jgi:CDGSH-type Zn-finger protein/truncated hemoglobin YjbI
MEPTIIITTDGPYRVQGPIEIRDTAGDTLRTDGISYLCRCGGSRHKPFCDTTHAAKCFDGTETADPGAIADRRDSYQADDGVTVYDDRTRCCHFGQCTARLASVFRADTEPFVDPTGAPGRDIAEVVSGCPSGALAYAVSPDPEPVEEHQPPSITATEDGPYRVRGRVHLVSEATGTRYEIRERQTLCRCGQSRNKPFCDGSHWYAEFRDPQPEADKVRPPSLFEWAGGMPALLRLTTRFYDSIREDPDLVLEPIFRHMDPKHPEHVAAWLAETFGGPATYTDHHGGYEYMVAKHRGLALTEEQREQWIARMCRIADEVGLPADHDFRAAFVAYLEWGTRLAVLNSAPDAQVIAHAPVPRWSWGESAPYVPQPWDDPDAATRGRERYEQSKKEREQA